MHHPSTPIVVIYQSGVFIPQHDVSYLAEGLSLPLHVPSPPDGRRRLTEATKAREELSVKRESEQRQAWSQGDWGFLAPEVELLVLGDYDLLAWDQPEGKLHATPLL